MTAPQQPPNPHGDFNPNQSAHMPPLPSAGTYAVGQYPCGPGNSFGPGPFTPQNVSGHWGAPPQKKRRAGLVISLIALAVVLIAGGAVGVSFLLQNKNDQGGMNHSGLWSRAWLEGHEKVWNLESPSHDKRPYIMVMDDKLIHTTGSSATGSTTITVFKLGDGRPEQLWQETVEGYDEWGTPVWGNWLIVQNTLIDINTREHVTAPWGAEATTATSKKGVIACIKTTCTMWESLTSKKWENTVPATNPVHVWLSKEVKNHVLAISFDTSSDGDGHKYFVMDLENGNAKLLEENGLRTPEALDDGWFAFGKTSLNATGRLTKTVLYDFDGTPKETFDFDEDRRPSSYPWSPTTFTLDQASKWFKDGDASWAPAVYSLPSKESCKTITVNNKEIKIREKAASPKGRGSICEAASAEQAVFRSGKGQIVAFREYEKEESAFHLVDMVTGQAAEPIFVGDYATYRIVGDLLIVCSAKGDLTAIRAGRQ